MANWFANSDMEADLLLKILPEAGRRPDDCVQQHGGKYPENVATKSKLSTLS